MTKTIKSKQTLIFEIDEHIRKSLPYNSWYCGIASNPENRLFNDHNVPRQNYFWIYRECENDTTARDIERYFLNKGCKGGDGGGDNTTCYVYAYKIGNSTIE